MCGIFGYIGHKNNASKTILNGLKSLEYRGYDSWGMALLRADGKVIIQKEPGKIGDTQAPDISATIGIGHTRWATHGGISKENAHPHTDCTGDVVVVHNGIVENFEELKKDILAKGHTFKSETDSEVIAHVIEDLLKKENDLSAISYQLIATLKGMNAIIALFPKEKTFMITKTGSPLVIGKADHGFYIASDPSAILPHTKQVYFVEDKESILMTPDAITLQDTNNHPKTITYTTLSYDAQASDKGSYPHFMLKEIAEQPQVLRTIIDSAHHDVVKAARMIKRAYGTYLIGCGTASYAALAGTYLFSKIAKRHINHTIGSEFSYLVDFLTNQSLVIPLSQSGETIDTIAAVDAAKEKKAHVLAITNAQESTLYRKADENILLHVGPEKAVASTKAYTAKIAYLYLIAHELNGTYEQGVANMLKAIHASQQLINHQPLISKIASSLLDHKHMFILGRGVSYPAALESALKIKEVSYVHAEGFAAGELKHGVLALIEQGSPVIIFNPHDETYDDTLSAAHEVKARGGHVIGLSGQTHSVYDSFIPIPDCNDATIIPHVVVAQLLGYYLSCAKGYDPDKPRNLAKSVVVK